MEEGRGRMTVPAFGEWDMKNGVPDYSLDFSKIREMRKHSKTRGTDDDLLPSHADADANAGDDDEKKKNDKYYRKEEEEDGRRHRPIDHDDRHHHSPTGRKRFKNYFQCCVGASA